jgi:hypothetical protein
MLDVTRRRAAAETPASVLRRYRRDRFTRPSDIPWRAARAAEDTMLRFLPDGTELVTLAPVVPLGTHSAVAPVSQHKVMTTIRACEVAADPTNALALEAAVRRQDAARQPGAPAQRVRLAAVQRVVRAQQFAAGMASHFGLLAMVTAGRDEGSLRFETAAVAEHLRFAVAGLRAVGAPGVVLALTPLSDAGERIAAAAGEELAGTAASIVAAPAEAGRQAYYRHLCFKVYAVADGVQTEIGDGGFTDWTARLAGNGKERLLISGYGTDRLATLASGPRLACRGACRALHLVPVVSPPGRIVGRHVAAAGQQADGPVDQLTDDVGMAGVPLRLRGHVHQDGAERRFRAPPGHRRGGIEREFRDRGVRVLPRPAVHAGDEVPGLVRCRPHAGVRVGALRQPRQVLAVRAAEYVAEIAELAARLVLDEAEQVGACRRQRPPDVVLAKPVQLPQQGLPGALQVVEQARLGVESRHAQSMAAERFSAPTPARATASRLLR